MRTRLGDIIDDFCIKCKRLTNHAVVSMLGDDPAKVRCRTCYSDHDYRHEQAPPPKVDPRKAALLLQKLNAAQTALDGAVPPAEVADAVPVEAEAAAVQVEAEPAVKSKRARKG
jgi:hypothetical protein